LIHALRIVSCIEVMASEMDDYSSGVRGHVTVWANASSVIQFLPQDISRFLKTNHEIKIALEERFSTDIVRAVSENYADIGIFADNVSPGELQTFLYKKDKLVLLTPVDHPLAKHSIVNFEDTLPYDFIGLNRGSSLLARLAEAATSIQRTMKLRIQVVSFDAICHMVAAGLGIGIIPEQVARTQVMGTKLNTIPIADPWADRRLLLGVRNGNDLRPEAKKLLDFLKSDRDTLRTPLL
jgi:DNA-binding transcriptional LysR family regulator